MSKHKKPALAADNGVEQEKSQKTFVFQRPKIDYDLSIREFPWSEKQKQFIQLAQDKETKVILCKGMAGTSKSALAVFNSLKSLNAKKISEIQYVRVAAEASDYSLGFLKGTLEEKFSPYTGPLMDKMNEFLPKNQIDRLLREERIKGVPLGFLRGLTFNVCNVIVDECQNLTRQDLLLVLTRLGKFSKIFLMGDISQSDVKNGAFNEIYNLFNDDASKANGIHTFEFGKEDIFRNEILGYIIEKFQESPKDWKPRT